MELEFCPYFDIFLPYPLQRRNYLHCTVSHLFYYIIYDEIIEVCCACSSQRNGLLPLNVGSKSWPAGHMRPSGICRATCGHNFKCCLYTKFSGRFGKLGTQLTVIFLHVQRATLSTKTAVAHCQKRWTPLLEMFSVRVLISICW